MYTGSMVVEVVRRIGVTEQTFYGLLHQHMQDETLSGA